MFVVRRPFRNLGQMMAPGSVVEPAAIKRFKSRVAEGRIVEVTEHNFSKWREYFKVRMNVEIAAIGGVPDASVNLDGDKPDENKSDEGTPGENKPEDTKSEEAKPVVKVVVK